MSNWKSPFRVCLLYMFILAYLPLQAQIFGNGARGNGKVMEEDRQLSGFSAIEVEDGVDLFLVQGSEEKVIVKADENLLPFIQTEVQGGVLKISSKESVSRSTAFAVQVTFRNLERIEGTSGSDVKAETPVEVDRLEIQLSSGSDLHMNIKAGQLNCQLSSGSDAYLEGNVGQLVIEAKSGSDIKARDLVARNCRMSLHGGSDAFIYVEGELEVEAHGASDIHYSGNPKIVRQEASGASDIIHNH